jgi:hypothetical protein
MGTKIKANREKRSVFLSQTLGKIIIKPREKASYLKRKKSHN